MTSQKKNNIAIKVTNITYTIALNHDSLISVIKHNHNNNSILDRKTLGTNHQISIPTRKTDCRQPSNQTEWTPSTAHNDNVNTHSDSIQPRWTYFLFHLPICPSIITQLKKKFFLKQNKPNELTTTQTTYFVSKHNNAHKCENEKRKTKPQLKQRKLFVEIRKLNW